jgi:hypothetical protein
MAEYRYPSSDVHRPETLQSLLGSHWNGVFSAEQQIRSLVESRGLLEQQRLLELTETRDSISRLSQPLLRTQRWHRVLLLESERNSDDIALLRYADEDLSAVYGTHPETGALFRYGTPHNLESAFPRPADLQEAPFLTNGLRAPSVVLTHGQDFYLDSNDAALVFRTNPFDDSRFVITDIYEDGEVVDRSIEVWLFRSQYDQDLVYRQFGYVIDLHLESTAEYRDYVNAIWDAAVLGASAQPLDAALAALTDTPLTLSAGETVEHIVEDARHLLVITDQHVYRFPQSASAVVAVGDTLPAGAALVDTLRILEFHRGEVPDIDTLQGLELGEGFLVGGDGYTGGISFYNRSVPLEVDSSGIFTRVEFEVGGFAADVALFWEQFHSRGELNPPTLAQLLDLRESPTTEPTAASLPATINPLEFLIQNVLRNHAFVARIRTNQQGPGSLPLSAARKLRKIIPPHTALLIVTELSAVPDSVDLSIAGTDSAAGLSESQYPYLGGEPFTESLVLTDAAEQSRLRYVNGICL